MEVKSSVDEVVKIGKEITGFWGKLGAFFGAKPKAVATPKPVAKKKEKFVAVDETQVMVDVVKQLTEFFRIQEQLAAHIREEEQKSLNVYDPNQNHMEAALKRVMAQQEMDRLVVQIRECMVYQSPPEMGALYSSVYEMRDRIEEEQTQARLKEEAIKRQETWQRRENERNLNLKIAWIMTTLFLLLYLWGWFLYVRQLGKI